MTQYNSLNVKLSNSQLNKFKSAIKNETEIVLRLSSNMIGDNNKSWWVFWYWSSLGCFMGK